MSSPVSSALSGCPLRALDPRSVIEELALVLAVQQWTRNQKICSCEVAGCRDVVDHREPQQGLDVDIVRMWFQRVPEKDQKVDLALSDLRADLLVAP
jgi:hypothetical protein